MNVGAVGAIGGETASVYAANSPYLDEVERTSDAASAATLLASAVAAIPAATAAAIAARAAATSAVTAAPPFDNPAIADIAMRIALGQALTPPQAVTPNALLAAPAQFTGTTYAAAPLLALPAPATVAATEQSTPAESELSGDGGKLIQSYAAVALLPGTQSVPPVYGQPVSPAVTAAAAISSTPRVDRVA